MYELIQAIGNTYYIESPAKIGIYVSGTEAYLIDSGSDKDAGRRALKVIREQGWEVKAIFNTHSHADHCGGNQFIFDRTGCEIYAPAVEEAFENYPILEPAYLWGGYPMNELRNKFLMAQPSCAKKLTQEALPAGFEMTELSGHYFGQVGLKTPDGVWFLADSIVSAETVAKYHVSFLYDPRAYLESIEKVKTLEGKLFIPSHAAASENVSTLADVNREKVLEVMDTILAFCAEKHTAEEIIRHVFTHFSLEMNIGQFALVGSTVRSYLSCLHDEGKLEILIEDNYFYWQKAE